MLHESLIDILVGGPIYRHVSYRAAGTDVITPPPLHKLTTLFMFHSLYLSTDIKLKKEKQ
jgi:hypothetical protein